MILNIFYETFCLNKDIVKYFKNKWLLTPSLDPTHKYAYVGLVFILGIHKYVEHGFMFILGIHKYTQCGYCFHLGNSQICIMQVFFSFFGTHKCITKVCFDLGSSQMQNDKFVNLTLEDLYHT
jgi:hypothetical protein